MSAASMERTTMPQAYEVVWDGTRARNPYLVAEREVPQAPPPVRERRVGVSDQVLAELHQRGEGTMRELAAALDLDVHAVNGVLWSLIQRGAVVAVGESVHPHRRTMERVYAPTIRGSRA